MANHFRNENRSKGSSQNDRPLNPNSRAAVRARMEAEEREKREWIAERKRREKEAAEAEAREKAAWIAERKREEQRREEELRSREKAAKAAERKRKAEKRAEKTRQVMKGVKIALLVILCLGVLVGGAVMLAAYKISNSDTNFPNITLNGIPVGGLTREETEKKLVASGWGDPEGQTLRVELPMNLSFELNRAEAGLVPSLEDAVKSAFSYGHDLPLLDCVKTYFHARHNRIELGPGQLEPDHDYVREKTAEAVKQFREKTAGESYFIDTEEKVMHFVKGAGQMDLDQDKLIAAVEEALLGTEELLVYNQVEGVISPPDFQALYDELNVEPVNAHFSDSDFEVIPGTPGITFDVAQAKKLWVNAKPMEEILIPLEIVEPEITEEQLKEGLFKDCLGAQTSSYGGSTNARVNNINLAVSKINGTILMPGQTFSYNGTVGERTLGNGFQEAAAYSNGEVVQEVGGGICQVSSTLYCATLYARMTIVDRTNHYFRVTYLPPGQDATVSWDEPDFQFRNDREYPVKIVAFCDNDSMELTIQIWGTDTDGIWVKLSYDQYAVHDDEYPDVVIGSNVYLWISYFDADGNYLETREGPASTYYRHDYEIDWPPEKFQDDDDEGGGTGEVIIEPGDGGGDDGGGDEGGGDDGGGEGGGDDGGGGSEDPGEPVIIEDP